MLNKKQWIAKHGEYPHHWKFKYLRWKWTPKICECKIACILDTSEKVKNDTRR